MPFKFRLYHSICWLLIAVTAAVFFNLVYELTRPGVTSPAWGVLLLMLFVGCYFMFPALGLSLIHVFRANHQITRAKILHIRIIFFLQIIFQGLLAYSSIEMVDDIVRFSKRDALDYSNIGRGILMESLVIIMFILTIYLEIFTFPLIKFIRNYYKSLLEQIDNLGSA